MSDNVICQDALEVKRGEDQNTAAAIDPTTRQNEKLKLCFQLASTGSRMTELTWYDVLNGRVI